MNRLRAIFLILFSRHYLVYTRRNSTAWLLHHDLGLGDTMRVVEGANEIEEDLIQMDENCVAALEIANGE